MPIPYHLLIWTMTKFIPIPSSHKVYYTKLISIFYLDILKDLAAQESKYYSQFKHQIHSS